MPPAPTPPLTHAATLILTGWPAAQPQGITVNGLHVQTTWRPPDGPQARVTVTAYPRTGADGSVKFIEARASSVRPARYSNGAAVRVIGHLVRLDPGNGTVQVRVYPAVSSLHPFLITMQATRAVLMADPSLYTVELTGRVMSLRRVTLLLAETIDAVHAPIPARWRGWSPARQYGAAIEQAARTGEPDAAAERAAPSDPG